MSEHVILLLSWLVACMMLGGGFIKNIENDHPYVACLNLGMLIYWTIRFGKLFLLL